jgi:hypothetical protein
MSVTVCLCARCIGSPKAGGHQWAFLNWALGLRALGCKVIWLELIMPQTPVHEAQEKVAALKSRLERYDLAEHVALCSQTGDPLPRSAADGCLGLEAAAEADLLLNLKYSAPPEVVERFRRSALLDIDPGLLQIWMSKGQISVARHDVHFTIGEMVGNPPARFPDLGLRWQYTPPCVALEWWPPYRAAAEASFTTLAHWYASSWTIDDAHLDDKRSGFLPFLDLPRRTSRPLELALDLEANDEERIVLQEKGWRVCDARDVASTPWDYQRYIQGSRGEFSCAKPAYKRLQNAWVSDRTLCYLASGKPAVVQHTGPSQYLPDAAGLFRFQDVKEAAHCLEKAASDYDRQCRLARALAEEYFDARKVVGHVLERALP